MTCSRCEREMDVADTVIRGITRTPPVPGPRGGAP